MTSGTDLFGPSGIQGGTERDGGVFDEREQSALAAMFNDLYHQDDLAGVGTG